MSLFSKQNREVFSNPLNLDNPIMVQVLGICSAPCRNFTAEAGDCYGTCRYHYHGIL